MVQVFDKRPQTVAVRGNQNLLSLADSRRDGFKPERQEPGHGVFQALCHWQFLGSQAAVARVASRVLFVAWIERRRRNGIAAPPDLYLILTVPGGGFRLVETL